MRLNRHNKALTLVELMAALAIVSMLLTAAMAVIGSMSRAGAHDQLRHDEALSSAALCDLLRADLLHTRDFLTSDTGCTLKTRMSLDARTMERQHIAADVEYAVRKVGTRSWLVRTQRCGDDGALMRDVVCPGVSEIRIERMELPDQIDAPATAPATGVSPVMTCVVEFDSPDRAPVRIAVRQD
ncbi:MAG: type II secretion system protein J [Phycisphaerae bacterium]